MQPSRPLELSRAGRAAVYSSAAGPGLRRTRLIARIDRNYEQVFAAVVGGGLLAIASGVLVLAVSVIG